MDRPEIHRREMPESDTPSASDALRPKDWVDELIEMTRPGIDMELPGRGYVNRILFFEDDDPS